MVLVGVQLMFELLPPCAAPLELCDGLGDPWLPVEVLVDIMLDLTQGLNDGLLDLFFGLGIRLDLQPFHRVHAIWVVQRDIMGKRD